VATWFAACEAENHRSGQRGSNHRVGFVMCAHVALIISRSGNLLWQLLVRRLWSNGSQRKGASYQVAVTLEISLREGSASGRP
jgi:hypothetical protein